MSKTQKATHINVHKISCFRLWWIANWQYKQHPNLSWRYAYNSLLARNALDPEMNSLHQSGSVTGLWD